MLQRKEGAHRTRGRNVRFINGLLGVRSARSVPRTIYTYSKHPHGSGASRFEFNLVHSGKPRVQSKHVLHGPAYDIRDVVGRALALNPGIVIAIRLDVEGDEL